MASEIGWHSNTWYCKLLCNGILKTRSALQHHVLQVTVQCDIIYTVRSALQRRVLQVIMKWDIKNPICTPTPCIASYYEIGHQKSDCTPTTGIDSYYAMRHQKCDLHSNTKDFICVVA